MLPARANDYFYGSSPVVLEAANWDSPPAHAAGSAMHPFFTQGCVAKNEVFKFWINPPGTCLARESP